MLLLLLACATQDPAGDPGGNDSASDNEDPLPLLEPAAVAEGLAAGLDALLAAQPTHLHDTYESVLYGGDEACPWRSDDYSGQEYWEDDCTAADGSSWYGWALSSRARAVSVEPEGRLYHDLGWYYGAGRVESAVGSVFEGWGSAEFRSWSNLDGSGGGFFAAVGGTWGWSGPDPDWLAGGLNHGWTLAGTRSAAGTVVTAEGGLSRLPGELDAFSFEGVVFDTDTCPAEPAGVLNLRHGPALRWYRVRFDPQAVCDGCGSLDMDGQDLGEVCVDMSAWVDWARHPWERL